MKNRAHAAETENERIERENERAAEIIGNLLRCEYDGAGLCDCVDNDGEHYPSQDLTGWVKAAEEWASARNALSHSTEKEER